MSKYDYVPSLTQGEILKISAEKDKVAFGEMMAFGFYGGLGKGVEEITKKAWMEPHEAIRQLLEKRAMAVKDGDSLYKAAADTTASKAMIAGVVAGFEAGMNKYAMEKTALFDLGTLLTVIGAGAGIGALGSMAGRLKKNWGAAKDMATMSRAEELMRQRVMEGTTKGMTGIHSSAKAIEDALKANKYTDTLSTSARSSLQKTLDTLQGRAGAPGWAEKALTSFGKLPGWARIALPVAGGLGLYHMMKTRAQRQALQSRGRW